MHDYEADYYHRPYMMPYHDHHERHGSDDSVDISDSAFEIEWQLDVVPKKVPVKKDPNHPQTILPWNEEPEEQTQRQKPRKPAQHRDQRQGQKPAPKKKGQKQRKAKKQE